METQAWVIIGVNALVVAFGFGAAHMRLKSNSAMIAMCQSDLASVKEKLWQRLDLLSSREGRHYRNTLVALTAVTAGAQGNPKSAADIIRDMADDNGE